MRSHDIRRTFQSFFTSRDHRLLPGSPLVPDTPTLLLSNAGMNQFVPVFRGETEPPYPRATTVQKCARTGDIEEVGRTNRHATLFEMLGSFSFGDYFKEQTTAYALELLTDPVHGFGVDRGRLWITVYRDDDEAVGLWRRLGIPDSRIQRLGMRDNYWSMGVPGPAGPSSEVFYDRGPAFGPDGGPAVDGERFLEIWNLVFMQTERGEGGEKEDYPVLGPLPRRHIDTGLGLERFAAVLQDVQSVHVTDTGRPVVAVVEELSGRPFPDRLGPLDRDPVRTGMQVVADHAKAAAFLVADGVLPSSTGRGYVLRRLLRRALRQGRLLGVRGPLLPAVTAEVVSQLGGAWPELTGSAGVIEQVVTAEEESFGRTLDTGGRLLDAAVRRTRATGGTTLPGDTAFELHGTYGFPLELTVEAAEQSGLGVDTGRFRDLLDEDRRRSRAHGREQTAERLRTEARYRELHERFGDTEFTGYGATSGSGRVLAVLDDGDGTEVLLSSTPFYARSGGQVGDTGVLRCGGRELRVVDTVFGVPGLRVHRLEPASGTVLREGDTVEAVVDADRRRALTRSHSATHILHAVVREVLGDHARQHGSLVEPDRLRFDFVHFSALTREQLTEIERRVNGRVLDDPAVRAWYAGRAEAEEAGALALFGERYGDTVRIVDIGDFSRELCGGTHVGHGSQVGPFRLLSEESVGANLRRVEAVTGPAALRSADRDRGDLDRISTLLGTRPAESVAVLERRLGTLAELERELRGVREQALAGRAGDLAAEGPLVVSRVDGVPPADLRPLAAAVLDRIPGEGAVVLGTVVGGKALLVAGVTGALLDRGVEARELLATSGRLVGGGAGGRGRLANAGGRLTDGFGPALEEARRTAEALLQRVGH